MVGSARRWAAGLMACVLATFGSGAGPPQDAAPPTYGRDVAPVFEARCRGCHRKGQVGPFPLDTYAQAKKRAGDIGAVVSERSMPPWKPVGSSGPKLKHDRALPAAERALIAAWVAADAPEGARLPPRPVEPPGADDGWPLGAPDVVLEMAEPFEVPAESTDIYRCFVIPTALPRDVYVSAVAYRPGNRAVVHHMTSWVDAGPAGRKKDAADPGPGYACFSGAGVVTRGDLGGWAPGNESVRLPEGIGRPLPKGADVILQVHYHPVGKAATDRSRMGLYIARGPIRQTLQWNGAGNFAFTIPAGAPRAEVRASWVVPVDVEALGVAPHMHRLGRDIRMDVSYPDGRTLELIRIDDWDMNWQNTYYFETPLALPRGSVVRVVAHFDNSASNPRNPHQPPRAVVWGEGSDDEMCVGYIAVVKKGQDLTRPGEADDLFSTFVRQRQQELRWQRAAKRGTR